MAESSKQLTRRQFGQTAIITGGMLVVPSVARNVGAVSHLPRRQLGKTGMEVSILGIGSAPFGTPEMTQKEVNRIIDAAIDVEINYMDTAPNYQMAERRLGVALKGKRDKFVLVTKVEACSRQDAVWFVEESLLKLQTDYLDIVHLHNVGRTDRFPDLDALLGKDGALSGLKNLKQQGVIRHIGLTSHLRPKRALPILQEEDIELVMCAVNFVDCHTYNFEGTIFSEAKKRGLGIVAMKILGGQDGQGAKLSDSNYYQDAVRYVLSIPGLSVAIMGMKNVSELKKAVDTVLAYKPFSESEVTRLRHIGKAMAAEWGELRGPVSLT